MSGLEQLVGFIACTDGARARGFYVDLLGLGLVSDDQFALVLRSGATTVRVQKLGQITPQPFTVLGWQVSDLDAQVTRLHKSGVIFERYDGMAQDRHGIWAAPTGARIVWFRDPDGNLLSLTQMPDQKE